jgi:hypothetical protein
MKFEASLIKALAEGNKRVTEVSNLSPVEALKLGIAVKAHISKINE